MAKRYLMNAGRTTKQGQQINVGKDSPEYQAIVSTMTMHAEDMKAVGIQSGGSARVRHFLRREENVDPARRVGRRDGRACGGLGDDRGGAVHAAPHAGQLPRP